MSKFAGLLAAHPPLSATEIGEIARKPALDAGDFCRLTETEITSDHDRGEVTYIISQAGVHHRPVADHLLSQLYPGELNEVLEQMRHALSFPCTSAEIVAFVKATDRCFTLPEVFVKAVTGIPGREQAENPDERAIRLAKMRSSDMTGSEISKVEGDMSVSRANELARKGTALLKQKATNASTMSGQFGLKGVAAKKPRTKA